MAFARLGGIDLHWQAFGAAERPAVVFANSLGTDLRLWLPVAARLAPRWRVVLADLRGHGLSTSAPGPVAIADLAGDVTALADHLGLSRFAFVGLSIGGLIGQALALAAPERLAALVLANTAARIGSAESWAERIAAVERSGMAGLADAVTARWFAPGFATASPAAAAGWRRMLVETPAAGYAAACAAIAAADFTGQLGAIATPTLVVAGDGDRATPPDLVAATAAAIPGSRFVTLTECGHLPPAERPEAFADLVARHLTECGHV
jgi:3-oxoadipate enol-lactonase